MTKIAIVQEPPVYLNLAASMERGRTGSAGRQ